MSIENIDHVVVNEEGNEVVELQIDEYEALTEALRVYQKENSLLEVHVSQLNDTIEKLEEKNQILEEKIKKFEDSSDKRFKNIKIIADHLY